MTDPMTVRTELFEQERLVQRTVRALLRDTHAAEDVVQDVWLRLLRRDRTRPTAGLGWAVTTARHVALTRRRGEARRVERETRAGRDSSERLADARDTGLERVERRQRVTSVVLTLPEPYRTVVLLRYEEGLDFGAIAARTGVSASTARSQLSRAHDELRRRLDTEFGNRGAWAALAVPFIGPRWVIGAALAVATVGGVLALRTARPAVDGATPTPLVATSLAATAEETPMDSCAAPLVSAARVAVAQEPPAPPSRVTRERKLPRAELLDRARYDDYERATFSFLHGLRDDPELAITRNNWDIQLADSSFDVRMVVDDQSVIADLGAVDPLTLADSLPDAIRWADARRGPLARLEHTYLVLNRDDDTDLATVFRVVGLVPGERAVLDWYSTDGTGRAQGSFLDDGVGPSLVQALEEVRERARASALLARPDVFLQVQVHGGGGNARRIDIAGQARAHVDEVVAARLDLSLPILDGVRDRAYHTGGWIPKGTSFVITRAEVRRYASEVDGVLPDVRLDVGGERLALFEGDTMGQTASWTGERALRAGMEATTFLQLEARGGAEVWLTGRFEPRAVVANEGFGAPNQGFFVTVAPDPIVLPELARPSAMLQVRAGAGGGNPNRIDLVGRTSNYVDHVRAEPLDLARPLSSRDPSEAYFVGGRIPDGQEFVVTKVTWNGRAQGDSNGSGYVQLVVDGVQLVDVKTSPEPISGSWAGALVVSPFEEGRVYVEVGNSSALSVSLEGRFQPRSKEDGSSR